jgi:hypothetical protein
VTTDDGLVHREVMELRATPAQVLEFVMTPERILDYYPDPIEGGVFEEGRAIWCRGATGVSMLERVEEESSGECLVVLVTTAAGLQPPYTPESIRAGATFTMVEDWAVLATTDGTKLTKSWRDITMIVDLPFSMEDAVRETSKGESEPLVEKWNAAAQAVG